MSKKKLQERKKKQRELDNKEKLARRRRAIEKKRKYDKEIDKDVKASEEKLMPYVSPEKNKLRVQKQIENNMKILRQLEEQYEKEQKVRGDINKKLEGEGHETLQEKVVAMGEMATALAEGEFEEPRLENDISILPIIDQTPTNETGDGVGEGDSSSP